MYDKNLFRGGNSLLLYLPYRHERLEYRMALLTVIKYCESMVSLLLCRRNLE